MITIKPHHFMDVIKLYGSGIEVFVPDEKMGHNFYKSANEIINNPHVECRLTVDGDDICLPCIQYIYGVCDDGLPSQLGTMSKDEYNKSLDKQILALLQLNTEDRYCAYDLCKLIYENKDIIFKVWSKEDMSCLKQELINIYMNKKSIDLLFLLIY